MVIPIKDMDYMLTVRSNACESTLQRSLDILPKICNKNAETPVITKGVSANKDK